MRRTVLGLGLGLSLLACGDDAGQRAQASLAVQDDGAKASDWRVGDAGAELTVEDLECPHGGMVGKIEVVFNCYEITTVSCKDLSNVVIELADGTRQRFEGLSGQRGVFRANGQAAVITRVWVKAGSNHSGDGPGYGERFEAPEQVCPPSVPPGDAGCFVADGTCEYGPTPPKPPSDGTIAY